MDLLLDVLILSVKYFSASQGLMQVTPVADIGMGFNSVCAGVDVPAPVLGGFGFLVGLIWALP